MPRINDSYNNNEILKVLALDLKNPRYDQSTYGNRCKHFIVNTNPFNLLLSKDQLELAKKVVVSHNNGTIKEKLTKNEFENLTVDQTWKYKNQYDSAYHPETGKLQHGGEE